VRNLLVGRDPDMSAWPAERLDLPMRDGSGDMLAAIAHRPAVDGGRATVLLLHGLTGCAGSRYVLRTASVLLAAGRPVVRLDLRGAGASRPVCRGHYHAGRTGDLRDALAALPADVTRHGVAAVGYSLGANMLLKHLGEAGERAGLVAAAAISAPIDLAAASRTFLRPRNALYHRWLLARMREETLAPAAELTDAQRAAIRSARSVFDFDDRFVAPSNGFAGADDYYARCSAERFLPAIRLPTLVVHALDDPWIPGEAYRRVDWRANPCLQPALASGGGHVGFHAHGDDVCWHDRMVTGFLDAVGA